MLVKQRGDTLIEVLLAMAIMSMVVVGTLSIMNFSFAKNLDTGIRSRVQSELNGQANILRAARDAATAGTDTNGNWNKIIAKSVDSPVEAGVCVAGAQPFMFKTSVGDDWTKPVGVGGGVSAQAVPVGGDGIWIEAYKYSPIGSVDYYDFYIKACWHGNRSDEQLKSVVRLYAPAI